jgi:nucleoside-diphosphate-sugar epimerase
MHNKSDWFKKICVPYCAVLQVNVGGLENVLKVVKRTPTVKKIIYTSSFFAIGPTDGYVADETQVRLYS